MKLQAQPALSPLVAPGLQKWGAWACRALSPLSVMSVCRAAPSKAVLSHGDVSLLGHHPLILSFPSRARVDDIVFILGLFGFF